MGCVQILPADPRDAALRGDRHSFQDTGQENRVAVDPRPALRVFGNRALAPFPGAERGGEVPFSVRSDAEPERIRPPARRPGTPAPSRPLRPARPGALHRRGDGVRRSGIRRAQGTNPRPDDADRTGVSGGGAGIRVGRQRRSPAAREDRRAYRDGSCKAVEGGMKVPVRRLAGRPFGGSARGARPWLRHVGAHRLAWLRCVSGCLRGCPPCAGASPPCRAFRPPRRAARPCPAGRGCPSRRRMRRRVSSRTQIAVLASETSRPI